MARGMKRFVGYRSSQTTSVANVPAAPRRSRFFGILRGTVDIPRTNPSPTVRLPRDPQQTGHIP